MQQIFKHKGQLDEQKDDFLKIKEKDKNANTKKL